MQRDAQELAILTKAWAASMAYARGHISLVASEPRADLRALRIEKAKDSLWLAKHFRSMAQ